jgi:hypothetical protein
MLTDDTVSKRVHGKSSKREKADFLILIQLNYLRMVFLEKVRFRILGLLQKSGQEKFA